MSKKALLLITIFAMAILIATAIFIAPTVGEYVISFVDNEKAVYSPDLESLTAPLLTDHEISNFETAPKIGKPIPPGFEIESKYLSGVFYQNSNDVIDLAITNSGDNAIFIYGFEIESPDSTSSYDSGYFIEAGNSRKIGLAAFEIPKGDLFSLTPYIYLLAQTDSGKWYDYGLQEFDTLDFTVAKSPEEIQATYYTNPDYYFDKVNEKVNATDPLVRSTAVSTVREYPGKYNIYQLCSLFDYLSTNVQYVSDPHDSDYWATPVETINTGAGDCEDYALLMASLVEAIGGSSRIYLTDDHAFAAAYIGDANDTEKTIEAISEYYNSAPVYYITDSYGSWIMLDASSGMYAGDLPTGAAPTSDGWTFINQTNVTVIDIVSD